MTDLYALLPTDIEALMAELGQPGYRAKQLLQALYKDFVLALDAINTLPAALREQLAEAGYTVGEATQVRSVVSEDGQTTKLLLRMSDGTLIETVLMQYPADAAPGSTASHPRSTVCVSTQAGCAMGCVFCATGQMGFGRNLRAEEVLAQIIHIARILRERGEHITNIVFMGMGEPLANYNETIRSVRLLTDARAFGLGQRHITISTVGLIHAIDRLAAEDMQVGLAISLHAPNDELRQRLVPTAGPTSVGDLMSAARRFFTETGRRITFEYALIDELNDSDEIAVELGKLLAGSGTHLNVIPVNPTAGGFGRPPRARVLEFERILREAGVNCTLRVEKGSEISAACGQLRTDEERALGDNDVSRLSVVPVHGRRQTRPSPEPSQTQ